MNNCIAVTYLGVHVNPINAEITSTVVPLQCRGTGILKHTKLIVNFRVWSRTSFQKVLSRKRHVTNLPPMACGKAFSAPLEFSFH
ncbi:hypothetical protein CK203_074558 [Vitis vinifera]|uniref:Uncharacterized protein n=1 Tax=Vitis vinifera TaxID=29760 RepID=A0A438ESD5_VITVI|nr:hypothetical protein CK203_074558 [Vitis vinifera]